MSTSKTARASAVKTVGEKKAVIPDAEMIRQLRINLNAGIFTANQDFVRALVREYDALKAKHDALDAELNKPYVLAE